MAQKRHVVITGGAGFIGSHLCELLLERGYAVTAIDNLVTGRRENLQDASRNPNFRFLEWDVSQRLPEKELAEFRNAGVWAVMHFACPASPVDFDRIPFEILAVDSFGTRWMTELALETGARFVLASTSEVYGDPLVHPQREDYWGNCNSAGPRSCYDEAKRFSEAWITSASELRPGQKAISYFGRSYSPLDARIVRIFNTYGPRMRPDDGRVVPELCMQALSGRPLTLHGDGEQTRSFCYVSDLIDGIVRLMESDVRGPVNIGNPIERSVREFAEVVLQLAGSRSVLKLTEPRPDDPRKRCPDITRARSLLGWEPRVDLEEGLRRTLEYFKTHAAPGVRTE